MSLPIKSLHLINFQSHLDSVLKFVPGVNVIIGPSDSGKSSIVRAFRWIIENRPAGDEFRSDFAGKENTSVEIELDDDRKVGRIKGPSINAYWVDKHSNNFHGFNMDVPRPVAEALNLGLLNIQYQHDRPFLLDDSPGEVARTLNKEVHLDKIDSTLANINSKKKEVNQNIQGLEMLLADLQHSEAEFPDLVGAEEFIKELEETQIRLNQIYYTHGLLLAIQNDINSLRIGLAQVQLPEGIEQRLNTIESLQTRFDENITTKNRLQNIKDSINIIKGSLEARSQILLHSNAVALLLRKQTNLISIQQTYTRLKTSKDAIDLARNKLKTVHESWVKQTAEFKRLMPNICPLCEQEIPHEVCV